MGRIPIAFSAFNRLMLNAGLVGFFYFILRLSLITMTAAFRIFDIKDMPRALNRFFILCGFCVFFFGNSFQAKSNVRNDQPIPIKVIAYERFDGQSKKQVDELALFSEKKSILLNQQDRYFVLRLDLDSSMLDSAYYRIDDYDPAWIHFDNGAIRTGVLPEGNYTFIVAQKIGPEKMVTLFTAPIQVKAAFFYGIRGYVFIILSLLLLLFLFFRGRTMILRRDKRRTVKMLENTVQKRTEQLQLVVAQRELLLKEIHHRVKNNLQVISALLEMQGSRTTDENVRAAIMEGQNRVLSIAFIHQNLYQHDDLKGVEIGSFLKELISHIRQVFERPDCPVEVTNLVPEIYLDIDSAIPLGLIINELLTNSYKYAFQGRTHGNIRIELKALTDGEFYFCFHDDGVGLPADYDVSRSNSLGIKLIRQLSRQLAGNIVYSFQEGSTFDLTFKDMDARSKMI